MEVQKKYCSSCTAYKDITEMKLKQCYKTRRWVCEKCFARKTESIYSKSKQCAAFTA